MILECATPLHCGGGQADPLFDQPVARDAFGIWRIPGSSVAGSLRALARAIDPALADKLFGHAGKNGESGSRASLVWCEDALLLDYDGIPAVMKKSRGEDVKIEYDKIFIRDHVKLALDRGSAVDGGKFDCEIVPAGARFLLQWRCDGWSKPLTDEEKHFFDRLCGLALAGELPLGGKTSNGYGKYKVIEASLKEIDLFTEKGMSQWLAYQWPALPSSLPGESLPLQAGDKDSEQRGLCGVLEIPFMADGPILIGGGQFAPDGEPVGADMAFALSPYLDYGKSELQWRHVLPATALKGVLRHKVYDILADLGFDSAAEKELGGIFGNVDDKAGSACGKVAVEDCLLKEAENTARITHVAIDRFTGGALAGALFDEEPLWAKNALAPIRLHVNSLEAHHAALLFHSILDLASGLAVGSGVNRGNGRLRLPHWPNDPAKALSSFSGTLAWNGQPLLGDSFSLVALKELAGEWQNALRQCLEDQNGQAR